MTPEAYGGYTMQRLRQATVAAFLVISALLSGCAINPVSGQSELRLVGVQEEINMGRNVDAEVRKQYKTQTGTAAAERVQRIGEKIAAVSDRKNIDYHFALLESDQLNAFAAPGGFIYVTTETEKVTTTDSELAAVIGHEVGHVAALHSVNQLQKSLGYEIFSSLAFGQDQAAAQAAADIAFNSVIMTGFSRADELQADELGVKYSWRAGYDPYGLTNFFAKLQERNRETAVDKTFEFLRSHPLDSTRRGRAESLASYYAGRAR